MKSFKQILLILLAAMTTTYGCKKDDNDLIHTEGYIVGFDPCTINHHYRIGYVIITADLKDTLITYNLSDNTYKMPASVMCSASDTLYKIPELYFQNFRNWPFFSDTLRYKYGIKFSYSIAKENEKIYYLCTTDILFLSYPQIIIKSATVH
ncbi:MAG: hypothetical protein EHM93_19930 [Bacteroidales bacterium]|nr:MAG: hypothetical protein EHM93_19930 [Bacteroidales bacterium]